MSEILIEKNHLESRNLFDKKEDLVPEGRYTAKFLGMKYLTNWKNTDAAIFYFYFTYYNQEYIAGFVATRRLKSTSLSWHLWKVLTGFNPRGYVTAEDLSYYKDVKLEIDVVHSYAKNRSKYYLKVVGVYPHIL